MALRDVRNFKFLKDALIQKFRRPQDISFKGIPYEPATNPQSIFGMFYSTFRELIQSKHLNLNQYLNIGDRSVLERLYLNLKRDPNLKFLDDADSVLNDPRYELTEDYYQSQSHEAMAAQQAEPVPVGALAGGEAPTTMAGGSHIPAMGIPTGPGISVAPGVRQVGKAPVEKTLELKTYPKPPVVETGLDYEGKPYQAPKIPSTLQSAGKSLGSSASIGIKRGITRAGTNLSGMLGGVGRGFGGILGGIGGGGVRLLSGTGGALSSIGTQMTRSRGIAIPGKFLLILLGAFFLVGTLASFAPAPGQQLQPGQQPPGQGTVLDYTIPFRDSSVTVANPDDIKNQVRARWANAQLQNWDTIVSQSIANNWNPAFVLALWIEETGAQGVPSYSDPLGCAPGQPTTDINLSLRCLFNNFGSYTNAQFADFMCRYSEGLGKPAPCQFLTNPTFPADLRREYSSLVPSITTAASCPVPGGTIKTPSYQAGVASGRNNGHCTPGVYTRPCNCGTEGRRAKAIDIVTGGPSGQNVVLPIIEGQSVMWVLIKKGYPIAAADGGGLGHIFETSLGTDKWYIDFLHMQQTNLVEGTSYPSETVVGRSTLGHVHTTLGKNNRVRPTNPGTTATDCDSGWLPSDFMCR